MKLKTNAPVINNQKLGLGLHTVKSVSASTSVVNNKKLLEFKFANKDGEVVISFFEPGPNDTARTNWGDGKVKPSIIDNLLLAVNLIITEVNPAVEAKYEFDDFDDLCRWAIENFRPNIETKVKVTNVVAGYPKVNTYIAGIDKNGELYIANKKRFIGSNIKLTDVEEKKIEEVNNATELFNTPPQYINNDIIDDLPI